MLNLDAYSVRDLQIFLQLCQTVESEGVTDLRFVRQRVQDQLAGQAQAFKARPGRRTEIRKMRQQLSDSAPCPDCGTITRVFQVDGMLVRQCQKCRWSALVEG